MLHSFLRYSKGYLRLQISGPSVERFFNLCSYKKINVWNVKTTDTHYELCIYTKDFKKIKPIFRKTKTHLIHLERNGMRFVLHEYRKRKAFLLGMFLCILTIYILRLFVWDISIEGNRHITDSSIVAYLDTIDVYPGMQTKNLDANYVTRKIRGTFDSIVWVSSYVKGNKLYIQVKENSASIVGTTNDNTPCHLVATKDGIVQNIITRKGIPLVKVGDTVSVGQILVSGQVPIQNDAREIIAYQEVAADADITIQYDYSYTDVVPNQYEEKQYTSKKFVGFHLYAWEYMFDFGIKKNKFQKHDCIHTRRSIVVGNHFQLPLEFEKYEIKEYTYQTLTYSKNKQKSILLDNYRNFCDEIMESGSHIKDEMMSFSTTEHAMYYNGNLKILDSNCIQRENLDFMATTVLQ